jgi:CubicO group peptidase (beta-lactamase class C family)
MRIKFTYQMKTVLVVVICAVALVTCSKNSASSNDGAEEEDSRFAEVFSRAGNIDGLLSLVISKDEVIIGEKYLHGGDPNRSHDVRSVTKSFTSALVGIAIDKGYLESVDQTLGEFISRPNNPEEYDPRIWDITIHQLLSMTSGLEWRELGGRSEFSTWSNSSNQVEYVLQQPFESNPGDTFNYNSGASHLVSVILSKATRKNTVDFAKEHLFDPIGIGEREWLSDNMEYNFGGHGLKIIPRDMIKFGTLYLNGGMVENTQVISNIWINESNAEKIPTELHESFPFPQYGYFWWLRPGPNVFGDIYIANGWGGQFIVIVPDHNLVVAATSIWSGIGSENADNQWGRIINLILSDVIPAAL